MPREKDSAFRLDKFSVTREVDFGLKVLDRALEFARTGTSLLEQRFAVLLIPAKQKSFRTMIGA